MLLQFKEPVTEDYRNEISAKGIKFISYIPENTWIVKSGTSERNLISENKVRALMPYKPEFRIEPHLKRDANKKSGKVDVHVELFESVSNPENLLERYGDIRGRFRKDTWKIETNYSQISRISREKKVKWIEPEPPEYETQNDDSRRLIEAESLQESPYNLKGTDFTAGIWDGGEVGKHEDLNYSGKLILGEESSVSDHAVHVAGTMLGAGKISSTYRGIAPETRVVSYDFSYSFASELYNEINESINKYDSILSQNSWGWVIDDNNEDLMGNYQGAAYDYDAIVSGETSDVSGRIPVIFSAGNEGDRTPRYNTTTGPGGTAKNTITVGAVDDSGNMNSFSSWGPTDDGRIKPTLVAAGGGNGDVVTSTYPTGSGFYPYAGLTGTSMSAPAVSGATILLTERFNDTHNTLPKPATVKATLIHTAEDLGREGPDYKYGWGLVNTTAAVNYIDETDKRNLIRRGSLSQGESNSYSILVPENKNISFTLVWSDYPGTSGSGKALINDLDLVVKNGENERKYPYTLSWENRTNPALQTQEDHTNPLEQVHVEDTNTTEYSVTVEGYDVPEAPQDYTLLMTSEDADTTSPNLTIESPENITYSRIPDFNISSNQSLESANYSIDRQQNYSMKQKNNTYFYNNTAEITDGHHEAVFWGENNFGNSSSENIFFTLDTQKPTVNPRNPKNKSKISESFNINLTYSDSLSGVDDINVSLENTSGIITSFSGNKTLNSDNYADGEYKIIFQVNDTAGNTEKKTLNITLDNTPPKINTLKPEKNEQVFPPFDILAEVKDSTGIVRRDFEISNSSGIQTSGSFNATNIGSNLLNGNYNASLETEDKAGNTQNKTIKFSISEEINLTIKSPENKTYSQTPDFNLSTNKSVSDAKYSVDNQGNYSLIKKNSSFFYNTSSKIGNGTHRAVFWANDSAGKWFSEDILFTLDDDKPSLTPKNPVEGENISDEFSIDAEWSDSFTTVENHDYTLSNGTSVKTGALNDTLDSHDFKDGDYKVYFNVTDSAGNTMIRSRSITLDNTDPNLQVKSPSDNSIVSRPFDIEAVFSDAGGVKKAIFNLSNKSGVVISDDLNSTLGSSEVSKGDYNISYEIEDFAGNSITSNISVKVSSSPNITLESPLNKTYKAVPDFNLSSKQEISSAVVEISNNNRSLKRKNDTYYYNNSLDLDDGRYEAISYANNTEDLFSNTSISFTIDTVPPSADVNLNSNSNFSSDFDVNATVEDSVSGVNKSTFQVFNSTGNQTPVRELNGTVEVSKLIDGEYNLSFNFTDNAGNYNDSLNLSFKLDREDPGISINSPTSDVLSGSFEVNFSARDELTRLADSGFVLSNSSNSSIVSGSFNTSIDTTGYADGNYTLNFSAEDLAGNLNSSSLELKFDNTEPIIQLLSPSGKNLSESVDVEAAFNDSDLVKKRYRWLKDGSNVTSWTELNDSDFDTESLEDGSYEITVEAEDKAGNSVSENFDFTIDNTAPEINLAKQGFENLSSKWVASGFTLESTCTDDTTGLNTHEYDFDGATKTTSNSSVDISFTGSGLNSASFTCIDYAGNENSSSLVKWLDSGPPRVESAMPLNGSDSVDRSFDLSATLHDEESESGVDVNASNLSIDSGSIEDINWSNDSFTANISDLDYATTFTVTGEIKDYAGQVHSVKLEYTTKSDPDSDDDSGGGGGGGGGGISIPSDTENQKKSEKSEEETPEMKVKRSENSVEVSYLDLEESWQEVDVSEMKTALSSVNVTGSGVANFSAKEVEKDPDPPNNTEIYNSLEMDVTSTGEVSAEASFLVSRSWLESKDLRPEKTSLYRKSSSGWEKLPTVIEDVGRNAFKYSSEIPDFSIFTVATEREKCVKKNYSVVRNGECSTVYKCEAPEDELVESCSSYESAKSSNSTNNNASLTAKMQVPDVGIPNTKYLKTALIFLAVLAILSIAGYLAYKWYEKHELKESLEEIKKISGKDPELIYNIDQTELAIEEGEYDKAAKMMTEIKEMIAEGQKS